MIALAATPEEIAAIISIDSAFDFGNVEADVKAAVTVALGNPQDLRDLALIPDQELSDTLNGIRLGEAATPLTAVQSTWSQAHD